MNTEEHGNTHSPPGAEGSEHESVINRSDHSDHERVDLDELAVPGFLIVLGLFLSYGLVTMQVPETAEAPGPRFFPIIITVLIFVAAIVYGTQIIIGHRRSREQKREEETPTDWKAAGKVVVALAAFALALVPLGWIVAGSILFWGVARGLGGRRMLFDLIIGVGMASLIQVAFSAGLGLRLPPGIFGWF